MKCFPLTAIMLVSLWIMIEKLKKKLFVTPLFTVFAPINIKLQLLIFAYACVVWAIRSKYKIY